MTSAAILDPANRPAIGTRQIVAVLLTRRGRIGLLRRSGRVGHQSGAWHCVTGFLDPGCLPGEQARQELWEEAGLGVDDVASLSCGPVLTLPDDRDGRPWTVHTFAAESRRGRLTLNWENDDYRWVHRDDLPRVDRQVPWLAQVVRAFPPRPRGGDPRSARRSRSSRA